MKHTYLQEHGKSFILFVEFGFIAANQADEDAALKLFAAAQLIEPENTLPKIGMGYLHLLKLELTQACKAFEKIKPEDRNYDMAQTFLGISTSMQPTHVAKGEKILEANLKTKDPLIKQLTHTAIDFVERYIKKSPGPATVQPKK